jgi:hypothetical protein
MQQSSRLIWNLKVHYRVQKGPPLQPVLSHMILINTIDLNIIHGAEPFKMNYTSLGWLRNVSTRIDPEISLTCSQESATIPYPVHIPISYFFKIRFNISFHVCLGLTSGLFTLGFPSEITVWISCSQVL